MDADEALAILEALSNQGVRYVLVGGVALNLQGLPRATADIDLFVDPSPDNISRLRLALKQVFEDPSIDEIRAEDLAGTYPAIQYVPPDGSFHIDILSRLGEAFRFEDIEHEERVVAGTRVVLATPEMLYRMKKDTVRLRDQADAERLRERFGLEP